MSSLAERLEKLDAAADAWSHTSKRARGQRDALAKGHLTRMARALEEHANPSVYSVQQAPCDGCQRALGALEAALDEQETRP